MKQAVIAPSMLLLLYPLKGDMPGYSRETFCTDLINEVRVFKFSVLKGGEPRIFCCRQRKILEAALKLAL